MCDSDLDLITDRICDYFVVDSLLYIPTHFGSSSITVEHLLSDLFMKSGIRFLFEIIASSCF
jgi:hypothetical protein